MDFPKSVPGIGLVDGRFVDENPVTGQQGSLITQAWGNQLTDEILNVLAEAKRIADNPDEFEPSEEKSDQLANAIKMIVTKALPESLSDWADIENIPLYIKALANITIVDNTITLTNEQLGFVLVDASTNNVAITLPLLNDANKATVITLMRVDTSTNKVIIKAGTGQTIQYNTSTNLAAQGDFIKLIAATESWYSITPDATTKTRGLIKIATDEAVDKGLETNTAVTPAQLERKFADRVAIIYPNGGSAQAPANVSNNQRYVLDNPFPGKPVFCEAQLLIEGEWAVANRYFYYFYFLSAVSSSYAYGIDVGQLTSSNGGDSIVMRTGKSGVSHSSIHNGRSGLASAPCRIRVFRLV